jgi:hypothetical protein
MSTQYIPERFHLGVALTSQAPLRSGDGDMNSTRSLQSEYPTRTGKARPLMRAVCSSLRSAVSLYSRSVATEDVSDGVVISTVALAIGKV